jgi:hypothetical protein
MSGEKDTIRLPLDAWVREVAREAADQATQKLAARIRRIEWTLIALIGVLIGSGVIRTGALSLLNH